MGDEGKLYVPEDLVSVYREKVCGLSVDLSIMLD